MATHPESIKIALSADGHSGALTDHPTIQQWKEAARDSRRQGAQILAHIGDWTHNGLPEEAEALGRALVEGFLGETEEEQAEAKARGLQVVGTLGNHDWLHGLGGEVARTLRDWDITILENETTFFEFANGGTVGILGMDGSVSPRRYASIQELDYSDRTAAVHQATEDEYWDGFEKNMTVLEAADVDAKVILTHMPPFPEQYSDSHDHAESYDLSPRFRRRLAESGKIDFVGSGHVHSTRRHPMWRRIQSRGVSAEGVVFYNVAGQTRMQEEQPLMEIVELPIRRTTR